MSEASPGPDFHPLYLQVKELLIQRVLSGGWKPGELLPSETKLAAEYHVSQGTVRKALDEMAAEHLVMRYQGKGTFVAARESQNPVHFFSVVTYDNRPVSTRTTLSLKWHVSPASDNDQRRLSLDPGAEVIRIHRVRVIDGEPVISEKIVISNERFPGLGATLASSERLSTYLVMERDFGVMVVRAEEWVSAIAAGALEAGELGIDEGTPLLQISRVSYALDGSAVEWRTIRLKSDKHCYHNIVR